jgi:hypothetical protein
MEQALIIMFNKMLDPWSVVREWEFDRTSQWQWLINSAEWFLQKLKQWWAWIKNEAFEDIVNIANILYKASEDTMQDLKTSYTTFAEDLWADPNFVNKYFDWYNLGLKFNDLDVNEQNDLSNIFWTWINNQVNTWNTYKTKSWKSFNINFNMGDLTPLIKEEKNQSSIYDWWQEQMNIPRTWTNVAKDTNNPWNITADSIPSWYTKQEYWKLIGATWTYKSPNGREYFYFPDVSSWQRALLRDITAKIKWNSRVIKPDDSLSRFQRVYVWQESPWYLAVLTKITWASANTPIKNINPELLTQAVMKAEWFI